MTTQNDKTKRFHMLMMASVDNELSAPEQQEFEELLSLDEGYRQEYNEYLKIKEVTQDMALKEPEPEIWDTYWVGVYNRLERGIAWIFFSIGAVILGTFFGFKLIEAVIADHHLALVAKIGILFSLGGLTVLLVSVVREKYFTWKNDPYKEIQR